MNDLAFISDVIYQLKHEYGDVLTLEYLVSEVQDVTTGQNSDRTIVTARIARAITMPTQVSMAFIRSLLQSKGLSVPQATTQVLIDRKDIPLTIGFELGRLKAKDKDNKYLNIASIDVFEYAVILHVTRP